MNRMLFALLMSFSLVFTAGCASKKYVRQETGPMVDKVNELDELTAKNSNDIRSVDTRAQQGIQGVQAKAAEADQKAVSAGRQADEAQNLASQAANRVNTLTSTVANLDSYRPVVETSVHFGFDKADLTRKAKAALDQLASEVGNTKHYIVEIEGSTDSVGDPNYNYGLSQRRASSVIQYLAEKHNIPAHKIYVIGLGEDKPVAPNKSSSGRAKNRRVDVRLLSNSVEGSTSAQMASPGQPR